MDFFFYKKFYITNMDYEKMLQLAEKASQNAYVPYSKFPVGACVLCKSGNVYTGCNFENSSYGLTICAERNTVGTAGFYF